jgi:hypothetical protein
MRMRERIVGRAGRRWASRAAAAGRALLRWGFALVDPDAGVMPHPVPANTPSGRFRARPGYVG